MAKHCPSYQGQFLRSPGASRCCSVALASHAVSLCHGSCRRACRPCCRLSRRRAGTWAPHAAAPALRDVVAEAGHYVETALPFVCQNRLWSSTARLVQRRAPANSPELARLCAADNLSLGNLAAESCEPAALVNLWALKSAEVAGMIRWCPEHLLERARGVKRGVPEVAETYHCLQKHTEIGKHAVCSYTLWLVPKVNNYALCCESCF